MDRGSILAILFIVLISCGIGATILYIDFLTPEYHPSHITVGYYGVDSSLKIKLGLDPSVVIIELNDSDLLNTTLLSQLNVLVINDRVPSVSLGNISLMVLMGSNLAQNASLLVDRGITSASSLQNNTESGAARGIVVHPLVDNIAWYSMPEAKRFSILPVVHQESVLVIDDLSTAPLLVKWNNTLVFTPWVNDADNQEVILWPYFNYFLFAALQDLSGNVIVTFSLWPYSPVPHQNDLQFVAIILEVLVIF
ncbi:MAG: hypothetical protein QXL15_00510, partial [Candidatus Korarchaeota archaeon]